MARNYGNATLKNHIASAAPGTLQAMGKMFGISLEDFLSAVYGDPNAIKKLSDMGRLSAVAQDNLEKALEAAKLTIQTTGDVNKALADLTKQTQKSGVQVVQSIYDATLAESKMSNELTEARDRQANNVASETARHLRQTQLIQIQGAMAELMAIAKYQTDIAKEANKPLDAQDNADRAYDKAVNSLLWQQGSEANIGRIPKPNYSGVNVNANSTNPTGSNVWSGLGKLWTGFKNRMGI
jgi:hypothetical protein